MATKYDGLSSLERFEEKIIPITESGCWIWIGAGMDRYGTFYLPEYPKKFHKFSVSSHKAALFLYKGIVPADDEVVMHKCDITWCCNPDHLSVSSQYANMQDMAKKKRYVIPGVKLSETDNTAIAALRNSGWLVKDIADLYGISPSQCSRISRGINSVRPKRK